MSLGNVFVQTNFWTFWILDMNLPVHMIRQCVSDTIVMERVN